MGKEWGASDYVNKVQVKTRSISLPVNAFRKAGSPNQTVSDERLSEAYKKIAQIVSEHGDAYLPIFERLHKELEERDAKKSMMSLAKSVAAPRNEP